MIHSWYSKKQGCGPYIMRYQGMSHHATPSTNCRRYNYKTAFIYWCTTWLKLSLAAILLHKPPTTGWGGKIWRNLVPIKSADFRVGSSKVETEMLSDSDEVSRAFRKVVPIISTSSFLSWPPNSRFIRWTTSSGSHGGSAHDEIVLWEPLVWNGPDANIWSRNAQIGQHGLHTPMIGSTSYSVSWEIKYIHY